MSKPSVLCGRDPSDCETAHEALLKAPRGTILRRTTDTETTFFYRLRDGEPVERGVHPDGRVGDVYPAEHLTGIPADAVDVVDAVEWPTKGEDANGRPVEVLTFSGGGGRTYHRPVWINDELTARCSAAGRNAVLKERAVIESHYQPCRHCFPDNGGENTDD